MQEGGKEGNENAGKKMEQLAKDLKDLEKELKEVENLDEMLDQLADAKEAMQGDAEDGDVCRGLWIDAALGHAKDFFVGPLQRFGQGFPGADGSARALLAGAGGAVLSTLPCQAIQRQRLGFVPGNLVFRPQGQPPGTATQAAPRLLPQRDHVSAQYRGSKPVLPCDCPPGVVSRPSVPSFDEWPGGESLVVGRGNEAGSKCHAAAGSRVGDKATSAGCTASVRDF